MRETAHTWHRAALVATILCMGIVAALTARAEDAKDGAASMRLWYRQPAKDWNEALPVGNGRLGAMVFGRVDNESIQFNEETLWDGYPRDRANPKALAGKTMMGIPPRINSYQSFGTLVIKTPPFNGEVSDYRRDLDLSTGIASVNYNRGGIRYARKVLVSPTHQVIALRISTNVPRILKLRIAMQRQQDAQCDVLDNDTLLLYGQIQREHHLTGENVGMKFAAMLDVRPNGGTVRSEHGELVVYGAESVDLLLAAHTNYRGGDPRAACRQTLDAAPDFQTLESEATACDTLPNDEPLNAVKKGASRAGGLRGGCLPARWVGGARGLARWRRRRSDEGQGARGHVSRQAGARLHTLPALR